MIKSPKVFGIGFHKTGTTSLAAALRTLGYRTVHGDGKDQPHGGDEGRTLLDHIHRGNYYLPTFDQYDAFTDNPYFMIWDKIVQIFPEALYILTIRDEESWEKSILSFYGGRRVRPMRYEMFGDHADPASSDAAKETWLRKYREHNHAIQEYFKGKNNLLVMDISKGDGYEKLCPFLGVDPPKEPFPHSKRTEKKARDGVGRFIKRLYGRAIDFFR